MAHAGEALMDGRALGDAVAGALFLMLVIGAVAGVVIWNVGGWLIHHVVIALR